MGAIAQVSLPLAGSFDFSRGLDVNVLPRDYIYVQWVCTKSVFLVHLS